MSGIMKLARMLAGNGKLPVGKSISKITKIGTKIKVQSNGRGIFEKTVEKTNGDTFKALFGKKQGLLDISGKNQRGSWHIIPNNVSKTNSTTGKVYDTYTILEARVNGLKGQYKTMAPELDDSVDNFLYRYLVGQDSKITTESLYSRIFSKKSSINNYLKWSE